MGKDVVYEYRLTRDICVGGIWETIVTGGPETRLSSDFFDQAAALTKWDEEGTHGVRNVCLERRVLPDPERGWERVDG